MVWPGFDEVKKTSPTIELGEEEGGIGLGVCGFDPLKAWSYGAIMVATFSQHPTPIAADSHYSFICLQVYSYV